MTMFLSLAPFACLAAIMTLTTPTWGLLAAAAIALGVVTYDLARGASVKTLTIGAAIAFGGLGAYGLLTGTEWTALTVRLSANGLVLAIAALSLMIRLPFTLQYAREMTTPEVRSLPAYHRVNYILTGVWTAALVLMLTADLLPLYVPALPIWIGVTAGFVLHYGAMIFTHWYIRRAHSAPAMITAGS